MYQSSISIPFSTTPIEESYDSFELILGSLQSTDSRYIASIQCQIQGQDEDEVIIRLKFKLVLSELLSSYKEKELFLKIIQSRLRLVQFELVNRRNISMWKAFENAFLQ